METVRDYNFHRISLGSYRTYEEWKRKRWGWMENRNSVLTVPMRNGNWSRHNSDSSPVLWFLPYLWGMETPPLLSIQASLPVSSYRTYEEWKHLLYNQSLAFMFVLTVPMRNGNLQFRNALHLLNLVLTVPMRNGNCLCLDLWKRLRRVLTVPMRNGNHLKRLEIFMRR